MNKLVYPRDRILSTITLMLALLVWLVLIIGAVGSALIALTIDYILYLLSQSTLIAYLRNNGSELSKTFCLRYPNLHFVI